MKKIETSGIAQSIRMPFSNRSIDHLNDAIQEIGKAAVLAHQVSPTGLTILSGVTDEEYGYTDGWAFYNGEVYYIEHSGETWQASTLGQLKVKTVYRTGDPVLFTDNNLRNVHVDKVLEVVTDGTGIVNVNDAVRLNKSSGWQTSDYGGVQFRRDEKGKLEFRGTWIKPSDSDIDGINFPMFTLPIGYRPPVDRVFIVGGNNSGLTYAWIKIETNGEVRGSNYPAGEFDPNRYYSEYYFDGVIVNL